MRIGLRNYLKAIPNHFASSPFKSLRISSGKGVRGFGCLRTCVLGSDPLVPLISVAKITELMRSGPFVLHFPDTPLPE